ncbi:hypothetical protein P8452_51180 [Trifolium repens]|nr:hypothetical protein P8452_51180 [Trifolium repens]
MAYSKIIFLSILVRFLTFATTMAQDSSFFLNKICSLDITTANSNFHVNLMTLLSSLPTKAIENTEFYNPIIGINPSDSIYGLFMCRGDVDSQLCHECIGNATQYLSSECSLSIHASIWYNECTVQYSNNSFFPVVDTNSSFFMCNTANFSNTKSLVPLMFSTMNLTADEAASEKKKFATNERVFEDQTLYCLAQCTSHLSPNDCRTCLGSAIQELRIYCDGKLGGRFLYPSCNVRYELYPFYRSTNVLSPNELAPQTNDSISKQESRFPEDPLYLSQNCSNKHNTITSKNFNLLLSYLLSNATTGKLFDTVIMDGIVYGLFMCRRDLSSHLCAQCIKNAKDRIYSMCLSSSEEILNSQECISCLNDMISTQIPWSFLGSVGGRIMYPNCNLRFELFQFYLKSDDQAPRNPSKEAEKRKVISIVVPTIILAMLLSIGYYLLKGRGRKNRRTILRDNFGKESVILEPLQFDWAVIEAATNNFSKDNYIGEGGFGEVYKGILLNGQEVAMKRLSRGSKQGVEEFKNEVLLIAKLQHRNLVTFIGFCLEGHENILIYEFVPNKSLDYFLFDCHHQKLLTWVERFNIIGGIVRGILYLHEHSRLKVIHRDLKPSNILLDENMIPKISDFGLARIMEISQDEGSTNRIVGTYGYMAPEYAMLGQFSEKSDVYSFGVMLLEIVAGKKNISSYAQRHVADNLLNYVWRQWNDQTPLSILDPKIKEDYSEKEFIICIQIGLLCVQRDPDARPSMVTIASYLSSYSIELPTPQEPAFFLHDRTFSNVAAQGSSSTQFVNSSSLLSINQMSTTNTFSPR